jgi:hypothetical protein
VLPTGLPRRVATHKMPAGKGEKGKLKKKRKKVQRGGGQAKDYFDIYGPDARAEVCVQTGRHYKAGQTALSVRDIQELLQWVLGETHSPAWVFVKNKPLCQKVAAFSLAGVNERVWSAHQAQYPLLCGMCPAGQRARVKLPKWGGKAAAHGAASVLELQVCLSVPTAGGRLHAVTCLQHDSRLRAQV